MHWSVITQILLFNYLPNKGQIQPFFFHECSVVTFIIIYFRPTTYVVSLLDLVYFLFSYVNIRMIATFIVIIYILCVVCNS